MWIIGKSPLKEAIKEAIEQAEQRISSEVGLLQSVEKLQNKITELKTQVEDLTIQKQRKEEEFARKERDIEHKVGLERARQEFEIGAAKREATVTIREENLAADQKRFAEQMTFHETRFKEEVGYLKDLMKQILKRLPTVTTENINVTGQ